MYVIIYLIIYTRAVSVSSVVCGGGVLGVVVVSSVWCGGVLGGVSVSSVWCVVSFLVCGGGVVCGVLPGVWWWCGGGVLGGVVVSSVVVSSAAYIQPSTKAGTPRGSSVRRASRF